MLYGIMATTVIAGNKEECPLGDKMIAPRGYPL